MTKRGWLMVRVSALVVLLLVVAISHHAGQTGHVAQTAQAGQTGPTAQDGGHARPTHGAMASEFAAAMVPVGYQSPVGHFEADGPAESAANDHDDDRAHCLMSLCMAVLVLLLGARIRPRLVVLGVHQHRLDHAGTDVPDRAAPRRAGVPLLLSLCVMRT